MATKTLRTSHPLFNNIVRSLVGDEFVGNMVALKGGSDLVAQSTNQLGTKQAATWTAVQGIARNDTNWFAIDTGRLRKFDLSNNLLETNATPFASLPAGLDHIGDGFADGSLLYVPVSDVVSSSSTIQGVAKYNISDLSFNSYINMDAHTDLNASGCSLNAAGDEVLVSSFFDVAGSDQRNTDLYRFNKSTGAFIAIQTLGTPSVGIQGLTYASDTDAYYISSWNPTGSIARIYWYDSSFVLKSILRPSGDIDNGEAEGVEYHDNKLYFQRVFASPFEVDRSFMHLDGSNSTPPQFLDASLMGDKTTILMRIRPTRFFDFNTIFDNATTGNDWESWVYGSGELAFRINASSRTSFFSLTENEYVILSFTWDKVGGNVTCKVAVDGIYGTPSSSATFITLPPAGLYLAGINPANSTKGEHTYTDILVFDKVLSDAEVLESSTNLDDFYIAAGSSALIPVIVNHLRNQGIS